MARTPLPPRFSRPASSAYISRKRLAAVSSRLAAEAEQCEHAWLRRSRADQRILSPLAPSGLAPRDLADAVVLARVLQAHFGPQLRAAESCWRPALEPWEAWVVEQASISPVAADELTPDEVWRLYEPLLAARQGALRKRRGVYYTPPAVVRYLVAEADRALREQLGLAAGLASESTWAELALSPPPGARATDAVVRLVDPAAGAGVFLAEALRVARSSLGQHIAQQGGAERDTTQAWNALAPRLAPRLVGLELLPVAALLAKLHLAHALAETGYDFSSPVPLAVHTGDALAGECAMGPALAALHAPATVLVGNPPYASLSNSRGGWITQLVRGDDHSPGYLYAHGERLGERKTWLHDDYVKFLRLAEWRVETTGLGVIAFAVNHGWLDNATFRLLRRRLCATFDAARIVDLCGNRKRGDGGALGQRDENIFGIDQGVALTVLVRRPRKEAAAPPPACRVHRLDLQGRADEKTAALERWVNEPWFAAAQPAGAPPGERAPLAEWFSPQAPAFHFRREEAVPPEYLAAWSLEKIFPLHATAPVTARDRFVVAASREELLARLREFVDPAVSDAALREKYFSRTRSARYEPGDSRSWKLPAARAALRDDPAWEQCLVSVLYRPFDRRWIAWHPALIDWPRRELTQHLTAGNPALIARRQQLPGQPCNYFLAAEGLLLDGVIRSDNRGGESVFPLYRLTPDSPAAPRLVNLADEFVAQVADRFRLAWSASAGTHSPKEQRPEVLKPALLPEDILGYCYALFHSSAYRSRYAAALVRDFPRVPLVREQALFCTLAALGRQLVARHCTPLAAGAQAYRLSGACDWAQSPEEPSDWEAAEHYCIGGYGVLRKWLAVSGRSRESPEFAALQALLVETIASTRRIDALLAGAGGLPAVFEPR